MSLEAGRESIWWASSVAAAGPARGRSAAQQDGGPTSVDARELLDECERLWAANPVAALCCDTADSRRRKELVLEALIAYERLRCEEAPDADPLTVFGRWPACTVIALVPVGARLSSITARPDAWLRGWAESWQGVLPGRRADLLSRQVPGLAPLLDAAARAVGPTSVPEVWLDVRTGSLVVRASVEARSFAVEAGGNACLAIGDCWLVRRPVPFVTAHDPFGTVYRLPVVDPADPLVVFAEDGRLIPAGQPLPGGEAWLMHLGEPPAEAFDGARRVLEEAVPPVGWSRWWLGRISLDDTTALRSALDGGQSFGPWRPVLSSGPAEFIFKPSIEGLTDLDGNVVRSSPPELRLPGGPSDSWTIEIWRTGSSDPVRRPARGGDVISFGEGVARPMLGRFQVRADGLGARRIVGSFTVAEGVSLDSVPHLRVLGRDGGLAPSRTTVRTPPGVRSTIRSVRLSPEQTSRHIDLYAEGDVTPLSLCVVLPHSAIRTRIDHVNGPWEITPRTFTVGDLAAGAHLDVRIPRAVRDAVGVPELVAGPAVDDVVQRITGRRATEDVYRYDLGKMADTVRTSGTITIWLSLPGQEALVATVRGMVPAVGIECTEGRLRLLDRARHGALLVRVHSGYAPWLAPYTIELPEGVAEAILPSPFRDGGPLIVLLTPAGTPVTSGWPDPDALPRTCAVFRVGREDQVPALQSPGAQAMANYLARVGPLPDAPDTQDMLWIAAARASATFGPGLGRLTAQECAAGLSAHPVAALLATARTRLTTAELVGTLIRSGIPAHRFRRLDDTGAALRLWATAPLAALLLTSPLLPYLTGSPDWDPTELEPEEESLLDEARSRWAPAALSVLTTGNPSPGKLIAPGGALGELGPDLDGSLIGELDRVGQYGSASAYGSLFATACGARTSPAALSLCCALVARLAAQGDHAAAAVEGTIRHAWMELVEHAPEFVANDIVLAEFLVSGWHARHHRMYKEKAT